MITRSLLFLLSKIKIFTFGSVGFAIMSGDSRLASASVLSVPLPWGGGRGGPSGVASGVGYSSCNCLIMRLGVGCVGYASKLFMCVRA